MPIHLAIVDGQTLTRYGLRLLTQDSDIEIVAECQSAAMACGSRSSCETAMQTWES